MKTVLLFGDSIAHSVGGYAGGWADKLKTTLNGQLWDSDSGTILYELGVSGDTARDVLGRFEVELLARAPHTNPQDTFVILAAGVNDSKATNKSDNFLSDTDQYATTVQAFIRIAKGHAAHIVCVGLLPVDEARSNPRHTLGGDIAYFSNRRIKQFEAALVEACKKEDVPCVSLFTQVPTDWKQNYLADGLHPNDAGHEWIFSQLKPEISKMLDLS